MFISDSHRFGKKVIFRDEDNFFFKPRNAQLESLFFNKKRDAFIYDFLEFNKEYSVENLTKWESLSQQIVADGKAPKIAFNSESYSVKAARLLAYCTFFGVVDLHKENTILNLEEGEPVVRPIDVESMFINITGAAETLLIPSMHVKLDEYGLMTIEGESAFTKHPKRFLVSFLEGIEELKTGSEEHFKYLLTNYGDTPIRYIIRPTREYYRHLDGTELIEDLVSEEIQQLNFSDIPYFHFSMNDTKLKYFGTEKEDSTLVLASRHRNIEDSLLNSFDAITSEQRLTQVIGVSIVQLIKCFPTQFKNMKFESDLVSIDWTENGISINYNRSSFKVDPDRLGGFGSLKTR